MLISDWLTGELEEDEDLSISEAESVSLNSFDDRSVESSGSAGDMGDISDLDPRVNIRHDHLDRRSSSPQLSVRKLPGKY